MQVRVLKLCILWYTDWEYIHVFSSPVLLINNFIRCEARSTAWDSEFGIENRVENERHWLNNIWNRHTSDTQDTAKKCPSFPRLLKRYYFFTFLTTFSISESKKVTISFQFWTKHFSCPFEYFWSLRVMTFVSTVSLNASVCSRITGITVPFDNFFFCLQPSNNRTHKIGWFKRTWEVNKSAQCKQFSQPFTCNKNNWSAIAESQVSTRHCLQIQIATYKFSIFMVCKFDWGF